MKPLRERDVMDVMDFSKTIGKKEERILKPRIIHKDDFNDGFFKAPKTD
jgi:hypothetical protein